MDNGCRGRGWPDVVGRHDVRHRSRGVGFGAGIAAYWPTRHWLICDRGCKMREWVATIVVVVVAIGLIWSTAVILKLVPVFDSGSVAITRAAE
jgi:hypothetical protein